MTSFIRYEDAPLRKHTFFCINLLLTNVKRVYSYLNR